MVLKSIKRCVGVVKAGRGKKKAEVMIIQKEKKITETMTL